MSVVRVPVDAFQPHRWMIPTMATTPRFQSICWHRRARKTTRGLNKLIREACATKNEVYAYVAPTYKQAKAIVVRDPLMLARYLPREVLAKPFHETELYATFVTGSVLRILGADQPDSIRGPRFKGVVLDEWALMKRAILEEILLPVLRENDGWCDLQFTPKGRNHAYQFHQRARLCPEDGWAASMLPVSESRLFSDDQLAQLRRDMNNDSLFKQEMECEFLESAETVFQGLRQCIAGELCEPEEGRRYIMGVDLGRYHDATVLTVGDCRTRAVVAWQRLTETHWSLQKAAIASMALRYQNAAIWIDATGAGSPVAEDLRESGLSVDEFVFSEPSKRALVDGLRVAIAQRLITFPDSLDHLLKELEEFEMTFTPTGGIRYGAPEGEGYYDDAVMSLALMVKGLGSDLYVADTTPQARFALEAALATIPENGGISFRP